MRISYEWALLGEAGLAAVLPLSPAWNAAYRAARGRVYATRAVKLYKREVEGLLGVVRLCRPGWMEGRMAFGVAGFGRRFTGRSRSGSDSDSRLKVTKDAVCEALGLDDVLVGGDLTVVRRWDEDFSLVVLAPFRYYAVVADFFMRFEPCAGFGLSDVKAAYLEAAGGEGGV